MHGAKLDAGKKRKGGGGCSEPGGGDMKESEVGEVDCRMKARAMRAFNSF